ncbi:hypothetical protein [Blautia sp.]|uniref:hypothetical protein n=1 Tax=Blautia sp. TaxID=1955243 RepID=UPI0015A52B7E
MQRKFYVSFMFFLIVLFTGCNSQTQKENSNINKELVVTPTSIPVKKRPAKVNTQELKIPRTEKEYKEKFGTIDESGNFIPPKDSYVDKETGLIYNSDGVIIGSECTPHPAKPGSLG